MDLHLALMQALGDLAEVLLARRRTPREAVQALHRALEIGGQLLDADAEALRLRHWRDDPNGAALHEAAGSR